MVGWFLDPWRKQWLALTKLKIAELMRQTLKVCVCGGGYSQTETCQDIQTMPDGTLPIAVVRDKEEAPQHWSPECLLQSRMYLVVVILVVATAVVAVIGLVWFGFSE